MERDSELALVGRLREGDASAFDAVFDQYHARLFAFLARLSGSRDLAEDLVEDTWLALVRHASRLRADTRLGPWLFAVARNAYLSAYRARQVGARHADDLLGLWPVRRPSPFELTAARELRDRVQAALTALSPAEREALLLVSAGGLAPAEAAEACGVTPEAMRQRLARARASLARELARSERLPVATAEESP